MSTSTPTRPEAADGVRDHLLDARARIAANTCADPWDRGQRVCRTHGYWWPEDSATCNAPEAAVWALAADLLTVVDRLAPAARPAPFAAVTQRPVVPDPLPPATYTVTKHAPLHYRYSVSRPRVTDGTVSFAESATGRAFTRRTAERKARESAEIANWFGAMRD